MYIQEAHTTDGWQLEENVDDEVLIEKPKKFEDRVQTAKSCVANLDIQFPAVVDDLDNSTEKNYSAWPDRLYLIGLDGNVLYKSKPGPFGFKPEELESGLKKIFPQ